MVEENPPPALLPPSLEPWQPWLSPDLLSSAACPAATAGMCFSSSAPGLQPGLELSGEPDCLSRPLLGLLLIFSAGESSIFSSEAWRMLLVLLLGEAGLLLCELVPGLEGGEEAVLASGNKLLMLNFPSGEDCGAGLEIGGNILDEAEAVKLPLTSCSNDPRIESELPSEFPSLVSDLLPTLLSLLPLCEEAVSMLGAFRNLGLPTHCWM